MKRNRQTEDSDDENAAATSSVPESYNFGLLRDMVDDNFFLDDYMARRYGMSLNDYRKMKNNVKSLVKSFMNSYAPTSEKKQLIEDYQVYNQGMDPEFLATWEKKLYGFGKIKKKPSAMDLLSKVERKRKLQTRERKRKEWSDAVFNSVMKALDEQREKQGDDHDADADGTLSTLLKAIEEDADHGSGKIKKTHRKKKGSALDILSKLNKMKSKKRPGKKKVSKKLEDLLLDRPIKIEPQSPPLPSQPKINEEPGIPSVDYFLSMLDKLEREGKVPKNPLL